jgi:hypothetical protein
MHHVGFAEVAVDIIKVHGNLDRPTPMENGFKKLYNKRIDEKRTIDQPLWDWRQL